MNVERQKRFLINFAYFGVIAMTAFAVLKYCGPALTPFLFAFVIAYGLNGPIQFLSNKVRIPRKIAAILVVLAFFGIAGTLISLIGVKLLTVILDLFRDLPLIYETHVQPIIVEWFFRIERGLMEMDESLITMFEERGMEMLASLSGLVSELSVGAVGFVSGLAYGVPGVFIKTVVMIISTFFISIDYEHLIGFCMRQMNEKTTQVFLEIKDFILGTLLVCVGAYVLIMSITFVELSIALSLSGVEHAILVAGCIAIFDILPVLGTGGIMIPWTIVTAVQGDFSMALKLLLTYLVITVVRNIIEPQIVGKNLGLHPVVTLASMFVGAEFFGVIGLFGAPIALALLRHLNDHGVIRIFR